MARYNMLTQQINKNTSTQVTGWVFCYCFSVFWIFGLFFNLCDKIFHQSSDKYAYSRKIGHS